MDKKRIGTLEVSALSLGCMGMTGFYGNADREQCTQTIQTAFEQGISFFDTADNYGFGENESLLGSAIAPFRGKVSIATKVGVVRNRETPNIVSINGMPEYIKKQCAISLKRLGVSTIDLYYLHHIDPNTPIEETVHAMAQLVAEGMVRHIGLGELSAENIRRAHKVHPITAIQAEYSLFSREAEKRVIPLCKELGIGFVACAPICRGLLSGGIRSFQDLAPNDSRRKFPRFESENLAHNLKIILALKKVAQHKLCSLSQLALAWVSSQSGSFIPLFGTTQPTHLMENAKSTGFLLTQIEIDAINEIVSNGVIHGDRHPEAVKPLYKTD
ncbi:MAG: aldo/keto reductase [Rhabdochlamydiaceae bacterium]|nr:aldo/keto reductase [Rhabdochlamydiaceae bacterium]